MVKRIDKAISISFYLLFFLVPLIVFPKTSELFEFNKMVFTYAVTALIVSLWLAKMVISKTVVFKRTLLDIPLLIFLGVLTLATIFSIDQRTSLLGYYSRFYGGLVSHIAYALLYWSFVSNLDGKKTLNTIKSIFASTLIVSIWGIFEHFGHSFSCLIFPGFGNFDVSCWVQDVQTRIFATMGQPNWLAAWLTAVIPLTWSFTIRSKFKIQNLKFIFYLVLSGVYLLTLLYTGSRSGFLAFLISALVFWVFAFFRDKAGGLKILAKKFIILNSVLFSLIIISGSPWTPGLDKLLDKSYQPSAINQPPPSAGPALEVGGTESGIIRQIVWKGAVDIWKNYPVLGSGVETFAFSYYKFKPKEHNLTSEWDYLYNKAHNEYLNFAATTGTLGLLSYLLLIAASLLIIYKSKNDKLAVGIASGYMAILITNFFGFSVVPVALLFFLLPAFAATLNEKIKTNKEVRKLTSFQISSLVILLLFTLYLLLAIFRYWYADYQFAQAKIQNESGNPNGAQKLLVQATNLSPNESIYWQVLSESLTDLAIYNYEQGNESASIDFAKSALKTSDLAVDLSPANVNLKRNKASNLVLLSVIDPDYLLLARKTLDQAVKQAPTDARLYYNWSLSYLRSGDYKTAIDIMEKTVELKPDYKAARYALALMYYDEGEIDRAILELEYILEKIDPNDENVRRELNEISQ